ncbi:hypothetical protein OAX78_01520 [Planctomycetota bacterium]|nr:hypothetical protein [Planctomycetota bacterium]
MKHLWTVAASAALLFAAAPAQADTVTLNNGKEIHGFLVEESLEQIWIRTGGGTIMVYKREIATYSENSFDGDYGRLRDAGPPAGEDAEGGDATSEEGGAAADVSGLTGSAAEILEGWQWPAGLSEDDTAELEAARDLLLEELGTLGQTAEERLAAIEVTAEEEAAIARQVQLMGWTRRQGSAAARRNNARDALVNDYGPKAIPFLAEALDAEKAWTRRMAASGLAALATTDDNKWLIFHFDTPGKILGLMDHQGDSDSHMIRAAGNEALETISGESFGFEVGRESLRTAGESAAYRAWREWWATAKSAWDAEQADAEARKGQIAADLETLRAGEMPEAEEGEDG